MIILQVDEEHAQWKDDPDIWPEAFQNVIKQAVIDGVLVPVEPDYEAMVEAGRKANIDLVPEECEMLFRAGIGGDG